MSGENNGQYYRSAYDDGRLGASDLLAARLDERALIVAWLRDQAENGRFLVDDLADEIDEGRHYE